MLDWSCQSGIFLFLDSNQHTTLGGQYECLVGSGAAFLFQPVKGNFFVGLEELCKQKRDWLFGHIAYDTKTEIEPSLASGKEVKHPFPDLQFFIPEIVMGIELGSTTIFIESLTLDPEQTWLAITQQTIPEERLLPKISFTQQVDHAQYLSKIAALRAHIRNGDCYEISFCTEGYCEDVDLDPINVFTALNKASPAPFAACYRLHNQYLMCASPERYLRKTGRKITAQPIKGTARRWEDPEKDKRSKEALYNSTKERAENIMIVDLMRNDLAKSCRRGSIEVEELFGIYSFPQVHQMISTITGQLSEDKTFATALETSFPMGSMTGAPKVEVMNLIEQYEETRRGLFAGTVGYISPDGDFDFNVVIRSLFYNAATHYLSYQAGGAITWDSNAQDEWEEMRLKASAVEKIFQ